MPSEVAPKITPATLRALRIIGKWGHDGGASFADKMWPDSYGHHRVANCGPNGATTGAAMPRAGGALLSRLKRQGLLDRHWTAYHSYRQDYVLSAAGKAVLDEHGWELPTCPPHNGLRAKKNYGPDGDWFTCTDCGELARWTSLGR
jgi:hypothetical protein